MRAWAMRIRQVELHGVAKVSLKRGFLLDFCSCGARRKEKGGILIFGDR